MSEAFERAVEALRGYAAGYAAGEGCDELPDGAWCATMVRAVVTAIRAPDAAMTARMLAALPDNSPPTRRWEWIWDELIDEVLRDV